MSKPRTEIRYKEGYINRILKYSSGKTKSVWVKDITGLKEGRITVISLINNEENRIEGKPIRWKWLCRCECGKETEVFVSNIGRGHSISCGCYGREQATKSVTTHGFGQTVEYHRWFAMISRCHNPNHIANEHYKKRNRTVCERWRASFESFLEDVGKMPDGLTLERGDNDQGYHCGKCEECKSKNWERNGHWDTWEAQCRNKENNKYFEYNGESMVAHDWAKRFGLDKDIVRNRLFHGWSVKRAIETPVVRRKRKCHF